MTAPPYDPASDGGSRPTSSRSGGTTPTVASARGHKFCREVCPVMQVTRNENHTPTAFHANIVAMEQGNLSVADVAEDYVHCTQCGACELRCPNTLFTGDFYRHRTRTVEVVKAMRALAVDSGIEQPNWKRWVEATMDAQERAGARRPVARKHVADWAEGLDLPIGGETILFVDCEAAFYRTSLSRAIALMLRGGGGVRPHAGAVVLRRAGRRDGLREPRASWPSTTSPTGAASARSGSSPSIRTTTSPSPRTTPSTSATTTTSRSSTSPSSWPSWSARAS